MPNAQKEPLGSANASGLEMSASGLILSGIAPIRQSASSAMSMTPVEANTQPSHVTKSDITYRGLILSGWPTHMVLV